MERVLGFHACAPPTQIRRILTRQCTMTVLTRMGKAWLSVFYPVKMSFTFGSLHFGMRDVNVSKTMGRQSWCQLHPLCKSGESITPAACLIFNTIKRWIHPCFWRIQIYSLNMHFKATANAVKIKSLLFVSFWDRVVVAMTSLYAIAHWAFSATLWLTLVLRLSNGSATFHLPTPTPTPHQNSMEWHSQVCTRFQIIDLHTITVRFTETFETLTLYLLPKVHQLLFILISNKCAKPF